MVDVKVDGKALSALINHPDVSLVDSYEDGGYKWDVYEGYTSVGLKHRDGDSIDVVLTFSVNHDIDGSVYVRDVNHILNSAVHIDDQDDISVALMNFNKNMVYDLENGVLLD